MKVSVATLADQVEFHLLTGSQARSVSALADTLLPAARPAFARAQVETALERMRVRGELLGALYPFGTGAEVSVPRLGPSLYRDLLLLSLAGGQHPGPAALAFDQLVEHALRALLPAPSQVISFAHPSRAIVDPRPASFPDAVSWLGVRLGLRTGTGYRSPARQDGGVDLVAVSLLAGSALAAPTFLVQTTVSPDVRHKARDVDVSLWRTWIDLSPQTQRCLAVPHEIESEALTELHGSGVIVLDRVRLLERLSVDSTAHLLDVGSRRWVEATWGQLARTHREGT